ncbi:hypothetical protein NQ314_013775 [Rhamnusium bicolor]|uniref:Endonuclease/exonuclease/phosphatase domain-containing protein n=1 Tax=Rhamnusium bicolor TaxID=1586634 RepID=A0AAV8X5F0_9CUCU|nr:hypothetical protein NQ314_013775 [Rhamnusium bicolor]
MLLLLPKYPLGNYEDYLETVMNKAQSANGEVIILGDLKAKAQEWGSPQTDARGRILCDWIATLNMVVQNDGDTPTCVRPNGESYIDITLTTQGAARKITQWKVLEEETCSDHRHIMFTIKEGVSGE